MDRDRRGLLLVGLSVFTLKWMGRQPGMVSSDPARDRFGVVAAGASRGKLSATGSLERVGVRWYYDYSARLDNEPPGFHKVGMVRGGEANRTAAGEVAGQARSKPGHVWLIFNEPDLLEQDGVSDAFLLARGIEHEVLPLERLYLLQSPRSESEAGPRPGLIVGTFAPRDRLLTLVDNTMWSEPNATATLARDLERLAEVCRQVPVFTLAVPLTPEGLEGIEREVRRSRVAPA